MTDEGLIEKSLVEQILDRMFANLEGRDEFDKQVIQELKDLAASGNLQKAPHVIKAIKSPPEAEP
jgi:hypothetical protein